MALTVVYIFCMQSTESVIQSIALASVYKLLLQVQYITLPQTADDYIKKHHLTAQAEW